MDITFNCEHCGQSLTVDESGAGSVVNCPKCSESALVPELKQPTQAAASNLRLCPDCMREVSKRATACPHCGAPLVTAAHKPQFTASTSSASKPKRGISVLRIVLMAVGGGMLLICALSYMNSDIVQASAATVFAGVVGALLLILAAIAK